ncbi:phage minor head protein [Streptomyces sp. A 4/2]|uniref:phage minor head protein n=1 Tax=Streptomyces sp. A 4/2 TaxID=2934314 RepID=UPI002023CEE0|nr:phage minor head protein [Streptomyces sp. A 4/2]
MPDRDAQLDQAEREFTAAVAAALTATADEFADAVLAATELVAARFSVGRIARMWGGRVSGLVRRLLGTAEEAATAAAEDVGADLPEGWDDLPGRYDDGTLPQGIGQYVETTEHLLRAVGDRLAEETRAELAAGIDAGEDIEQLRARLREAFTREGPHLGPVRERRIAQTEVSRAWNTTTLAAAQAASGPDRPVVKQWVTRHDRKVRTAHDQADGQIRFLAEPFTVGGVSMQTPGDPTAPAGLVINCRCRLAVAPELQAAALESQTSPGAGISDARENSVDADESLTAAGGHTGAMIALVPSEEDAERLALAAVGSEPAGELHLTLFYLGEGADWDEEHRADLIAGLRSRVADLGEPLAGRAFGAAHWNSDGDDPCWVWSVSDDRDRPQDAPTLETARWAATYALEDMHRQPDLPAQHTPWQAHVCAAYTSSPSLLTAMNQRLGPIRFDRLRVAFAGEHTDIPLGREEEATTMDEDDDYLTMGPLAPRPWSTPGSTALAFENTETGDGRVFRPGSLYWSGSGPWPLQHADEMLMGHQGAELAGSIQRITREGDRIAGGGVLYPNRPAGADAVMLLEEKAPLGVSVDLDDVSVEFVDRSPAADGDEGAVVLLASLPSASLLRLDDGSWSLTATATTEWTASGNALSRHGSTVQLITGQNGQVTAAAVSAALGSTGTLTAAAGDRDDQDLGTVVHSESSGDLLMRVTRARLRGATLVAMPAYDEARIVLDDQAEPAPVDEDEDFWSAAGPSPAQLRVVDFVKSAPAPVGAREVARGLRIKMETARGHLSRAAKAGHIVRLARGVYVGPSTEMSMTASVSGDVDLPVNDDPDRKWDGAAAKKNVLAWATGDDDTVDADKLSSAYLWRDEDADPATAAAYKLPFADVIDGELRIIAAGVYAVASVLQGGMGGVDLPDDDRDAVKARVATLYARLAKAYDDDSIVPPWIGDDGDEETASMRDLVASAWTAMSELPPMPAAWFKEPTAAELPPGSGGVHYADGRIYGWVAQAGEPHAGYPGRKLTIESLGKLDLTHFLRAKFQLDDGSTVRAGAFTMNAPHTRDGAECNDAACQFDDSRTVAGIVTVGQNAGGLWFSGAAGPWLSEWDRAVFQATQPSYHMKQGPKGKWQLRAVLSVPVPGHSSPLLATAVTERSNLALAASAAGMLTAPDVSGHDSDTVPDGPDTSTRTAADLPGHRPDNSADMSGRVPLPRSQVDSIAAALLTSVPFLDVLLTAMDRRQEQRDSAALAEAQRLAASVIAPAREQIAAGTNTATEGEV